MKLFATLFLSAVTTASLFAASIPRCDITGMGKDGKVKLTPGKVEGGLRVSTQNWGAEETRPYRLTAAGKAVGAEWTLCKLVFTPENSGAVVVSLCGQSAKKVEDRKGKLIPNGFWFSRNPVYVADGGPDGAAGVTVNHDNRLCRTIKVEAGKPVTIEFMAKAAPAPAE